jgi:hypothetical protein
MMNTVKTDDQNDDSRFLSNQQISELETAGVAIRVWSRKDPDLMFFSVAGHIYIWNGRSWRKTSQKYDSVKHL